jgi:hypothetical protein
MAVVADEMISAVTVAVALLPGLLVGRHTQAREARIGGPNGTVRSRHIPVEDQLP